MSSGSALEFALAMTSKNPAFDPCAQQIPVGDLGGAVPFNNTPLVVQPSMAHMRGKKHWLDIHMSDSGMVPP